MSIDEAVLGVMGAAAGRDVTFRTGPERISGGFWATIHGFELQPDDRLDPRFAGPLVLRVMPETGPAAKETIVQTALGEAGYITPRVVLSGSDAALGGPFIVMTRAAGRSPMGGLSVGPSPVKLITSLRRIPVLLAEAAGRLHAIDPSPIDAALRAAGIELSPLGDTSYRRDIEAAARTPARGFDDLVRWFDDHEPPVPRRVVCHGDLHPLNLLVDESGTVTVLDWTNANLCPPELDLGFTTAFLRCAPLSVPDPARPILRAVTNHLAKRFQRVYTRQPAAPTIDSARLRWYESLQYGRCLAEVALGRSASSDGGGIGVDHPFETSARDMIRELAAITGVTIVLPERTAAP